MFSLTSAWEALPFRVLEAMRAALPAVAYATTVSDQLKNLVVHPGDRAGRT